ncbi:uncharacterized protein LOC128721478 [Anopheles nili]|uniref:uncharacterized protein LOC128721478 n=1 Tax=Anopheles nili TaxID=185578 RepID=UPI00237BA193|nr:uncharacterized protein LOC128721478 [Anopheles nili]
MYAIAQFRVNAIIPLMLALHLANTCSIGCPNSTVPLNRTKRLISYPINGGLAKLLIGVLVPIRFHHPLPRSLNCAFNLQANYIIRPDIIFPRPESVFQNRKLDDYTDPTSRQQLYVVLEQALRMAFWTKGRKVARECLLRTVCEVADTPLSHNGLVGEVLDVIFTPQESDALPPEFLLARRYGANGLDCARVYSACPLGLGLLDQMSANVPNY